MTIDEIIAKRRRSWEKRHDIEYDKGLVEAAIQYIHKDPELVREIKEKPYRLIEIAFTIVDKSKKSVPFFYNEVQKDFIMHLENRDKSKPIFVLKGRQQGFTSLVTAIQLSFAIVKHNFSGFTVADCSDNTLSIFNDKARVVYDRLPSSLKPHEKYNNRHEFFFDTLNSSWRIATASNDIGRSKTIEFCHFSEVAFYECPLSDLQKSIGEAFVKDAIVIYETTAKGYNEAKDLWDSGACENLFYEWWRTSEYRSENVLVLNELKDSWIKNRVSWLRQKGLDDEQIAWYVEKYNRYLDKSSIRQEYPCMPEEAFIASGGSEFGNEEVINQIEKMRVFKPIKRGYFTYRKERANQDINDVESIKLTNIGWVDDENGEITIHELPVIDAEKGKKPYSIGGDTAGEGSDYYAAKVIDNMTGKTVATYHKNNTSDDLYAEQLYCLGKMYNDAIIGIEINFSYAPTKRLEVLGYPNLYLTEVMDSLTNQVRAKYGFRTSAISRPVIISELKRKWRDSLESPNGAIEVDIDTLREMLVFVKNDVGKPEALQGKHDDLVMSLAIAHQVSTQGKHTWFDVPRVKTWIEENFKHDEDDEETSNLGMSEYMEW